MRKRRKLLATLLTFVCLMATSMSVMAAEPQATPEVVTEAANVEAVEAGASVGRSASGYAADYTDSHIDSFTINVTGSTSSSGTAKIKAWDFSGNVIVYVSLKRPDGTYAFSDLKLTVGQEISKSFSNLQTGTYTLLYTVYGTGKGWIYCNIN